jgi:hypothetical protein
VNIKTTLIVGLFAVGSSLSANATLVNIYFDDPSASDSFTHADIGQHGTDGLGSHNFISWNVGNVSMTSKYNQPVSQVVVVGGEDDAGYWDLTNLSGPLGVVTKYDYVSGSNTYDAFAEIALVKNDGIGEAGFNNYPAYYARVALDKFELYRHQAYDTFTIVDSLDLASTYSGTDFSLSFSLEHTGGTEVIVGATFAQNGISLGSLSYTDPAGYTTGYLAISGGDSQNTGTIYGVEFTFFGVPEPSALVLMLCGGVLIRFFWRNRRS